MFSSKIILRKDVPRKDGTILVCLQCFVQKKRVVIPLNIHIRADCWIDADQRIDAKRLKDAKLAANYQLIIENARSRAIEIVTRYHLMNKQLTADEFRREYMREDLSIDFPAWMEKQMQTLAGQLSPNSMKRYRNVLRHWRAYKPAVSFRELNYSVIVEWENYLRKKGLSLNTRYHAHKLIKAMITRAIKNDIRIENPYRNFKAVQVNTERIYLDKGELNALIGMCSDAGLPHEVKRILQSFLFCCFTGLRVSDMLSITWDQIIGNELVLVPEKTKGLNKLLRIPLNDSARRYLPSLREGEHIFPQVTPQYINRTLKEAAAMAGIRKRITFHCARHTFATHFLMSGGKIEVLRELLGHSNINTTMVYTHIVSTEKERQMMLMDQLPSI